MNDFERFRNVMIITSAGRPKIGHFFSLRRSSQIRNVSRQNCSMTFLPEGERVRPSTTGPRLQVTRE